MGPLIGGLFSLVNGSVYLFVGRAVAKRQLTGDARFANNAFLLWWYALGGLSVVAGFLTLFTIAGAREVALHLVAINVILAGICAGFWGLAYYLLFLYTGRKWWRWPMGAFYSFYLVYFLYLIAAANMSAIKLTTWGVGYDWTRDPATIPYVREILLPFVVPLVLAAIGYMTLLLRVREPMQRYRIALVSGGFLVWFGSSLVASLLGFSSDDAWQITSRLISLVAALVILAAFQPPSWILRRLERPRASPVPEDSG